MLLFHRLVLSGGCSTGGPRSAAQKGGGCGLPGNPKWSCSGCSRRPRSASGGDAILTASGSAPPRRPISVYYPTPTNNTCGDWSVHNCRAGRERHCKGRRRHSKALARQGSGCSLLAVFFASQVLAYKRETPIRFGSICQYSLSLF